MFLKKSCNIILIMVLFSIKAWSFGGCIDTTLIDPNAVCPLIYAPVCGCDGITYDNDCVATSKGVTAWIPGECNGAQSCSATFTYSIVPVGAPGTGVQFANLSYPSNYTLKWDFGDGITFTGSNPFHLYFGNGPFNVFLEVSDGSTCYDTLTQSLLFGGTPYHPCVNPTLIDSSQPCPLVVMPVCACDGITYGNICEALSYGGATSFRSGACTSPSICIADFQYYVTIGFAGYSVDFYNSSAGNFYNTLWNFGDGNSSTDYQPQHTYFANNLPNDPIVVSLTISDSNSCNSTFFQVLDLNNAVNNCRDLSLADTSVNCPLVYDPVCGCDGITYGNSCIAQSNGLLSWSPGVCGQNNCFAYMAYTAVPGSNIVTFKNFSYASNLKATWSFGDSTFSNYFEPVHTFPTSGDYYVCLTIEDTLSGCINSYCEIVHVGVAFINCIDSNRINPNASCSLIYDPVCGCNGVTYDNECVALESGIISYTKGVCGSVGICNVSFGYVVTNDPLGYSVQFFNTSNNIPFGNDLWEYGDGTSDFSFNPTHIYTLPGVYLVCLTSGNPFCDGIAYCQYISVGSGANCADSTAIDPTVLCPQVIDPVCGCNGVTYNNSCEAYYVNGISHWTQGPCFGTSCKASFYYNFDTTANSIQFYNTSWGGYTDVSWSFGDGNVSTEQNPYYVFTEGVPQYYNVCLSIVNPNTNCFDTYCETVFIDTALYSCYADFNWGIGLDSLTGDSVVIFYNNSYAPNTPGQPADVQWVMNDSIMSNDVNVTVPFDSSGVYSVCLTVSNPFSNCSNISCDTVLYRLATSIKENKKTIGFVKAYPNPLQNETTIALQLSERTDVSLQVFDVMGKQIDMIKQGTLNLGNHQFTWNSDKVSNGIYYMYVKAGNDSKTIKLSVAR